MTAESSAAPTTSRTRRTRRATPRPTTCTGNYGGFANYDPLWIANYSASNGGPLPSGWGCYTFWQYADSGSLPGDQDVFNGAYSRLQVLADNG